MAMIALCACVAILWGKIVAMYHNKPQVATHYSIIPTSHEKEDGRSAGAYALL